MAKVTSKLQVTIPKAVADQFGIRPGDEVKFTPAGDAIRVTRADQARRHDVDDRLRLFDQATRRIAELQRARAEGEALPERGWTREDLYDRGRPR